MRLCAYPDAHVALTKVMLRPGEETGLQIEHRPPDFGTAQVSVILPDTMAREGNRLRVNASAPPSDPYPDSYDPLSPPAPALAVTITANGVTATSRIPFETPPLIAPAIRAQLSRSGAILNLAEPGRDLVVMVSGASDGTPLFDLPEGWQQNWTGPEATIRAPGKSPKGSIPCR